MSLGISIKIGHGPSFPLLKNTGFAKKSASLTTLGISSDQGQDNYVFSYSGSPPQLGFLEMGRTKELS